MIDPLLRKGTVVYDRAGKIKGRTTGSNRFCRLEGCPGTRIGVRWPDGKITWPCSKGIGLKKGTKKTFIIL